MTAVIHATFDGKVLRPEEPVPLEPDTRVLVTIETLDVNQPEKKSFLATARSLELEGPPDWSANLDSYLYGRDDTDAADEHRVS